MYFLYVNKAHDEFVRTYLSEQKSPFFFFDNNVFRESMCVSRKMTCIDETKRIMNNIEKGQEKGQEEEEEEEENKY